MNFRIRFIVFLIAGLCLLPFCGFAFSCSANAINSNNSNTSGKLAGYEKVFVQLSNSLFVPGEKIIYKAWIVNASTYRSEKCSSIIYYELLDSAGKQCMFWRSNTIKGASCGSMQIPGSLPGGVYTFRAFTNPMRNIGERFFFTTNVLITRLNDKDFGSVSVPLPNNSAPGRFEFFPEGGRLVANLLCKVGVRANVLPPAASLRGIVKDEHDSIVASFETDSYGLAEFSFQPLIENTYSAYIGNDTSSTVKYTLPAVSPNGFSVNVVPNNGGITLSLKSSLMSESEGIPYRINLSLRGVTIIDTLVKITRNVKELPLRSNKLSTGIINLQISDWEKEIVFEKLIYLKPDTPKGITVGNINPVYQAGEKISLQLQQNNPGHNDLLELSVVAVSTNPFQFIGNNNSVNTFLSFFSEIAGSYSSPINNDFSNELADKYLLCIDPKDYFWNKVKENENTRCVFPKEDMGAILTGSLLFKENQKPVCIQDICISIVDSLPSFNYSRTDSSGAFAFLLDHSYDNRNIVFQSMGHTSNNVEYTWKIDDKTSQVPRIIFIKYPLSKAELAYMDEFRRIKLVNIVYNPNENDSAPNLLSSLKKYTPDFSIKPSYSVFPGDYTEIETFTEITDNILSGVKIKSYESAPSIIIYDPEMMADMRDPAMVFLNGVIVNDIRNILNLKAKAISRIDVNQSLIMYGDYTINGILSVITKDKRPQPEDLNGKTKYFFNSVKESLPITQYEEKELAKSSKTNYPDLRRLLYLNQAVILNNNDPYKLNIHTSDLKDSYFLSIQGISAEGQLVSDLIKFEVK